jgi:peptide-methionine (S)-S-oxide reductase
MRPHAIRTVVTALLISYFHTLSILIPPVGALAVGGGAISASSRPSFYSEIVSPLAQKALRCAERGEPVPARLNIDDYNNDDDAISFAAAPVALVATVAGGCFWGLDLAFRREPGVLATCVGYTQGPEPYPTYGQVCAEETGHTEAVLLVYDPDQVSYAKLADLLFDRIPDPTMLNRVGRDRGRQYRTGMYAHSEEQLVEAQTAFDRENGTWKTSGRPVVTEVKLATTFWPAEEVHQRYLEKGGRFGRPQSAEKGDSDEIRCYG